MIGGSLSTIKDHSPTSAMGIFKSCAMTSMDRPVPAATLIIQEKLGNLAALVATNSLTILSSHVQDGTGCREEEVGTTSMASDIGYGSVGEGHVDSPVPCPHHVLDMVLGQSRLCHR